MPSVVGVCTLERAHFLGVADLGVRTSEGTHMPPCLVGVRALEGVRVAAHPAPQRELLPSRWVLHVQRTLVSLQLLRLGP